ncbi:Probable serine/threonine-protein kinase [Galdieria sulphuraria]|nr:Probable serine/threonine-protein kinase [Galdieria sulphuraria]
MAAQVENAATELLNEFNESKPRVGPYILGKTLGTGSTGKVKLAFNTEQNELVAVKIVRKDFLDSKPNLRRKAHRCGELFDYLVERGKLEPQEALRFFQQIISGLDYCHRRLICHRDLKPENLLLDKNNDIKIADFGMASLIPPGSLLETSCGSPHYASPEIVMGDMYNGFKSDVWSCGVILYALLTGRLPFDDDNIQRLLNKNLLRAMLTVEPEKRITVEAIQRHPWFLAHEPPKYPEVDSEDLLNSATGELYSQAIIEPDPVILQSLVALGWGDEESLRLVLASSEPSLERVFYRQLEIVSSRKEATTSTEAPEENQDAASEETKVPYVVSGERQNVRVAPRIQSSQEKHPESDRESSADGLHRPMSGRLRRKYNVGEEHTQQEDERDKEASEGPQQIREQENIALLNERPTQITINRVIISLDCFCLLFHFVH